MPRADPCVLCDGGDDEGLILICDGGCDCAYHAHCIGFRGTLEGDWVCGLCEETVMRAEQPVAVEAA